MKRSAIILATMTLAACSINPATQPQVTAVQACATYNAALTAAVQARALGKLSATQIDQITKIDNQVTPICTGSIPTSNAQIIGNIIQASGIVSAMSLQVSAQGIGK